MSEKKTVRKWMWVWEFDKEEAWLNEMAMNGWVLCSVGFCRYTFEKCEPGEYTVRLEMHDGDKDYIALMEETGAELIGGVMQWKYFRKRTGLGQFDIFSDLSSRIAHLKKIGTMLTAVGFANLAVGLVNSGSGDLGKINLLCATLLMYALGRIHGKKEALEKENLLRE